MDFKELPPVKEQIMKCVRCGKCRSVCPIFAEIRNETAAPRGHVFMVQMLRDGNVAPTPEVAERLTNCLMCETCSVNCPSGIDIHELNAAARSYINSRNSSLGKNLVFDTLWTKPGLLKTSTRFMWSAQKLGLQTLARNIGLTRLLPGDLPKAEKILDSLPRRTARSQLLNVNPARGEKRFTVGYFLGCASDLINPSVALATVDVLTRNGCEVIIPPDMKCCGLPHIANGKMDTAQMLAAHNAKIFNSYDFDYIITDCASCSSALSRKNMEFLLGGPLQEEAAFAFADKVMDLTQFLVEVLDPKIPSSGLSTPVKVTYHDPCHLANAQGIKSAPRQLLQRIPGLEFVEMSLANRCCGGSGTFSLTHYDLSMKVLDKKMESAMATGADIIATCCPSCVLQLRYGVRRNNWNAQVLHPVELLSQCYQRMQLSA
ncbi:MAG TPA: (Fe-S)-binding protein [Syntrophomonadaceae bacterium]|nr:(Fe-S)-binding protein [Syntrophomonadaceae bacterium]